MSSDYTPTPEQMAAISCDEPRFVVAASAGTGKTFVLVQRYLRHVLEHGLSPDQILAITFTKKAAAEMRSRIVAALRAAGRFEFAQAAETGPILTIDAFCQRVLMENCLELGIDPSADIAGFGMTDSFKREAVRRALSESYETAEADRVIAAFAGTYDYESGGSPYERLERLVEDLLDRMRRSGFSQGDLQSFHASPEAYVGRCQTCIAEQLGLEIEPGEEFFKVVEVIKPRPKFALGMATSDALGAELTVGLVRIALRAWTFFERRLLAENLLDFSLIQRLALDLLDVEAVRNRVRRQFKVALVDESQDLNPQQYRILERLAIEQLMLIGDSQQSIYSFREADVELFRKAELGLHRLTLTVNKRTIAGALRYIDLVFERQWGERYQPMAPAPEALALGADPFEKPPALPIEGVEFWPSSEVDHGMSALGIAKLLEELGDTVPARKVAVLVRTKQYGADLHRALLRHGIHARLVGISRRYFARLEIRDVANALHAVVRPTDDFAMACLLRSPFVGLSLDGLVLISQSKPIAGNLDAEGLSDLDRDRLAVFKSWFDEISAIAPRRTASEVLSELLARTPFLAAISTMPRGEQMVANVRKLQSIAGETVATGPIEFADQIREIQRLRHDEEDAQTEDEGDDAITIMTVHQAKGLQFEVVIVPETHTWARGEKRDCLFDPKLGLAALNVVPPEERRTKSNISRYYAWLRERREKVEEDEGWRLTYVALTRAEKRLCVVVNPLKPNTYGFHLGKAAGYPKGLREGVVVRELDDLTT